MKSQKPTQHFENDDGTCKTCIEIGVKQGQLSQKEKDIKIVKEESNSRLDCIRRIQGGKEC